LLQIYLNSCSSGAAALVIQNKPLQKFIQEQLFSWPCCPRYPNHTFATNLQERLFSWRCCTSNPKQTFAKIYTRKSCLDGAAAQCTRYPFETLADILQEQLTPFSLAS
jgi:hypothetical protein